MDAYLVGLLYMVVGAVLLFFGAKFMSVVLGVLGGFLGIHAGQVLVAWWGVQGFWAFLLILACAAAGAYVAVTFYKWFIAGGLGYFAGVTAYYLFLNWHVAHTWAVVLGIVVAAAVFVAVWRLNLIEYAFKFLTSVQGAIALTAGLYATFHSAKLDTLQTNQYDVLLGASTIWVILWVLAFFAGFGFQLRQKTELATTEQD